jgi:serine/threonine protein kinase
MLMNDPQRDSIRDCPDLSTLRRISEGTLPPSEEEAVIAHLSNCPDCQQQLEGLDAMPETIRGLRQMHRHLSAVDVERVQAECTSALPAWETRGGYVELMPGLRLASPRDKRFVARLGRFDVVGLLGRGGMGFVLEGFDPELQRPVALKVMKPERSIDRTAAERFIQEARSAARLQHPNVVTVFEVGIDEEPWFIVMEYVRGKSLSSVIDCESCLRPARAVHIILEVLAALAHAHEEGIIHRDVKPGNVLLDDRIESAKLADFGLARVVNDAVRYTTEGIVVGTPWYIAPEQATGQSRVDGRSDLFSTGVMLFEMVTGVLPFPGSDPREVVHRICHASAPDPRELDANIPASLANAINTALQRNPESRHPSATTFAEELHVFLEEHRAASQAPTAIWEQHAGREDPNVIAALLEMTQTRPAFHARVWIQRCTAQTRDILTVTRDNRDRCRIGEEFFLHVQADVDCCVTLLDVGTSGKVSILLLNHRIPGGDVVTLSGPDANREWVVGGPAGIERIKALFTRQPLVLPAARPMSPVAPSGQSRDIVTRVKQLGVTLEKMPADGWTDATCQFVIEAD